MLTTGALSFAEMAERHRLSEVGAALLAFRRMPKAVKVAGVELLPIRIDDDDAHDDPPSACADTCIRQV